MNLTDAAVTKLSTLIKENTNTDAYDTGLRDICEDLRDTILEHGYEASVDQAMGAFISAVRCIVTDEKDLYSRGRIDAVQVFLTHMATVQPIRLAVRFCPVCDHELS